MLKKLGAGTPVKKIFEETHRGCVSGVKRLKFIPDIQRMSKEYRKAGCCGSRL
jgi:hypothetical protein